MNLVDLLTRVLNIQLVSIVRYYYFRQNPSSCSSSPMIWNFFSILVPIGIQVQQAKRSRNKEKKEENQKKPKSSKALSAGRAQRARRQGAKSTTSAEREVALSARLRAQRDYEGPKPNFAPINKRASLGKRTHFLRAQFSDLWHSVLSFSFPFLIFCLSWIKCFGSLKKCRK